MACSCTEDFVQDGNVTIGYNKVTCAECLAAQQVLANERRKQEITVELSQIDLKSMRVVRDITLGNGAVEIIVGGVTYTNTTYLAKLEADAVTLRAEYAAI